MPFSEMVLGLLFLLRVRPKAIAAASVWLIVVLSTAFFVEIAQNPGVRCGCFGSWLERRASLDSPRYRAALSGFMIMSWLVYVLMAHHHTEASTKRCVNLRLRSARLGMTIVEMLATVTVVGVLFSFLLYGVSLARLQSVATVDRSRLRSSGQSVQAYTADFRGSFPYFASADGGMTRVQDPSLPRSMEMAYFDMRQVWHVNLSQTGHVSGWVDGAFVSPYRASKASAAAVLSDYWLPCVMLARREYWDPSTRRVPPYQFGGVREHEVSFPSHKAIITPQFVGLVKGAPLVADLATDGALAFADGSVGLVRSADRGADYGNHAVSPKFYGGADQGLAGLHTRHGIAGRDRRR